MIDRETDIQTADGVMNAFVTHPEEDGPFPVVLFYMDAPGKREELHDMARRIGTVGYYVVVANLYYRKSRDFAMRWDDAGRKEMFAMTRHLSVDLIMADTQALLNFVDSQPEADATRLGAVGYCMSGPFVFAAAGRFPDRFACAASIYGANLMTSRDDSPHLTAANIRGEMYFACAEIDEWASRALIEDLDRHMVQSGANYRIEWYPGAHHGFAFPQRGEIYDKASAERHWERLFSLLQRNLRRS
jgi:carboxymethylenebutenolidase